MSRHELPLISAAPDFSPPGKIEKTLEFEPGGLPDSGLRTPHAKQRRGGSSTVTTGWQQHQQHQQTARTKVRLLLALLASLAEP